MCLAATSAKPLFSQSPPEAEAIRLQKTLSRFDFGHKIGHVSSRKQLHVVSLASESANRDNV
jgi:hypothetical protein